MDEPLTIMVVGDDDATTDRIRATLHRIGETHLLRARNSGEAIATAQKAHPHLLIAAYREDRGDAVKLCKEMKSMPALEGSLCIVVDDPGETDLKKAGLDAGVDDFLTRPVDLPSLQAKLHRVGRIRRMNRDLAAYRSEIDRLRRVTCGGKDEILPLLAYLLDLRFPGAVDRGNRIAELALKLAVRFKIPRRYLADLEIIAKLHEIGRLVLPDPATAEAARTGARDAWKYVLSTKAIFRQIRGLEEAAELAGSIYENWDGTGMPEHLKQGQIPLRCRIVRILIDLTAAQQSPASPDCEEILAKMVERGGTVYDPGVVVHLRNLVTNGTQGAGRDAMVLLAITDLREGMILADDLYTDAGIKLAARGTRLTRANLETILWRNRFDPILRGAFVKRKCA
jgi:putative two-component system response regulator